MDISFMRFGAIKIGTHLRDKHGLLMGNYFYTSKTHKNRCPCLSLKREHIFIALNLIKIMSILISKMGTYFYSSKCNKNKCPSLYLKWITIFIPLKLIKICVNAYLSNGYPFL